MKTPAELEAAVRAFQNGNQEQFDSVYRLSHRYLYVCISHLVRDEDTAKDMLQETYLEIVKSIRQLQDPADFLGWASVIARRRCYAAFQKEERTVLSGEEGRELLERVADDDAFVPESILQDLEKRRLLREIIDGLSDMQRLCVIAYYYSEKKQEEIAEELGIPVNTVKSHLNRAKAKIKAEVLALEREKDTRLYTLAPFLLLFFAEEAEACEALPMPEKLVDAATTEADGGSLRQGWLARPGVKTKILIGLLAAVGVSSVIGVFMSRSGADEQTGPEGQAQIQPEEQAQIQLEEEEKTGGGEEQAENAAAAAGTEAESEAEEEETESPLELAISGKYDQLRQGSDGIIVVNSGGKWGLVTYDNEILVPFEYDYACMAPNDDGQTFFGNEGDYKVFDREGNAIFQTERPIKAVSEGVVLWVQTDMSYDFGYVRLDGETLYESIGENMDGESGAVGFNEGYAFSSDGVEGGEYRIAADGSVLDVFRQREALQRSGTLEGQADSAAVEVNGTSTSIHFAYPIGACCEGCYVDRGIAYFEDTADLYYVYDAEGAEEYPVRIGAVAEYAGYPYAPDNWDLDWQIAGFYHNGNYCYNSGTKMAVAVSYRGETKAYLIDAAKLEQREEGGGTQILLTDESVLAEGESIGIADTACWLLQKDGQKGYIDQDGNVMRMFDDAAPFYGSRAMAVEDGYAFFIDEKMNPGEWKIPAWSVRGCGEVFAVETQEGEKCFVAE
ncbi:MAG: sigma-70 family RNA polymerase sigma factor [Muribaculaceae bacterium]|nr:sigma-70 family RNA polymerase sigma factor [Muribaculaceae bacterium]